jgi:hypothetical protein
MENNLKFFNTASSICNNRINIKPLTPNNL